MRVLGIDPGTGMWGFVFMEEGFVSEEKAIQTSLIKSDPEIVLKLAKRAQLIVAPSGYGTVLKRVSDLTENDFFEILLKRKDETSESHLKVKNETKVVGLEAVLRLLKEESLNAFVIPGVKLLPTVSEEKKQGKIDMGTPDKVCAAAAGIVDQARRLKLSYDETNFVLAEIGFGFDAFIAVENGHIIDGIGGTLASSTWRGKDGEILYLEGKVSKEELRKNDVGKKEVQEGSLNDISKLRQEFEPKEILVSGSKSDEVFGFLKQNLKNVVRLNASKASNAAYGAAVIADGLAGGRFKEVVDLIGIKNSKGSNLDYTELKSDGNN